MPREIFHDQNFEVPEPPEETMKREQEVIDFYVNRPEGKYSPEMEAILEEIDFATLKKVFAELGEKHGIPEDKLNFLGKERIFSNLSHVAAGEYKPISNIILLTELKGYEFGSKAPQEELDKKHKENIKEKVGSLELYILSLLVHEETHAIAKNICSHSVEERKSLRSREKTGRRGFDLIQQGYFVKGQEYGSNEITAGTSFHTLNEGVTDKLSREVLMKYLAETGWPQEEVDVFLKNTTNLELRYNQEVDLVEKILKKINTTLDVSEDLVWDCFVSGLLTGERFENQEVITLFSDIFGEEFLKDLSALESNMFKKGNLDRFSEKYEL